MTNMTAEEKLAACLLAASALAGCKVRADVAQAADVAPYIVHTLITGTRVSSFGGDSGLANPHFQIDVYADTKPQAAALKTAIRVAVLAASALNATFINEGSGYEPDTKRYRHRQDFSCWVYN